MIFLNKILEYYKNLTRKQYIGLAAAFVLVIFVVAAGIFAYSRFERDFSGHIPVYFFNASAGFLQAEWFPFPEESFEAALGIMLTALPRSSELTRVTHDEGLNLINHFFVDESTLIVEFSEWYHDFTPIQAALFRSSLTLTMTWLPEVEYVVMRSAAEAYDGEFVWTIWNESANTIANNPTISPLRISNATFTLYFVDETGEGLVAEVYTATGVDLRRREENLLQRLIEGPTDDEQTPAFVIPPETRVRSVTLMSDAGGYYVDLSSEFVTQFNGTPAQARLMIGSIVNTLIENSDLRTRRVSFLIDSERREEFHGVPDFHLWFALDEALILGYSEYDIDEDYVSELLGTEN